MSHHMKMYAACALALAMSVSACGSGGGSGSGDGAEALVANAAKQAKSDKFQTGLFLVEKGKVTWASFHVLEGTESVQ